MSLQSLLSVNIIWAYTVPVLEDLVSGMGFTSSSSAYVRLSSSIFGWRGGEGERGREGVRNKDKRGRDREEGKREDDIEKGREKIRMERGRRERERGGKGGTKT